MRAVLTDLFGPAVVQPQYFQLQIWSAPPAPGRVYPCAYIGKPEFDTLGTAGVQTRHFVLLRDLRDTLASGYFSLRYTHENAVGEMDAYRRVLNRLSTEDGLRYLAETWLAKSARIQRTWLASPASTWFRVEDCFRDPARSLHAIFRAWGLDVHPAILQRVAEERSFDRLSGGRRPGQEDRSSHYRRGTTGSWRELFSPALARRFAELYNDVLIAAGYEPDAAWAEQTPDCEERSLAAAAV